ncbi:response regulator transcription factor [Microbacterium sp. 2FI]|uniref:response regulator transcription factor n=1 Tax=Microbacterium sp. 2FI TaxID=2502193 RepID=UPI0010F595D1|nr:response regulator transcription factor [Microbacterium sp. 2FI]
MVATEGRSAPELEVLSTTSFLQGRVSEAVDALTRAHEAYLAAADTVGAARTAGWLALQLLETGEVTQSATWVARGLRLAQRLGEPGAVGGLVALVPAALTALFVGDIEDAMRRFDEIAETAERSGDRELAAFASFGHGKCLTTIGRTAEGLADLDAAVATVVTDTMTPLATCILFRVALDVCHEGFDLERAERWTTTFEDWCSGRPGMVAYTGQAHAYRAQLLLLHGRWATASVHAHLAEEALRAGDFTAGYVANYQLGELHRLRGELRPAREHYLRAGATGWDPQPGLALATLADGDVRGAQTMIRSIAAGADDATRRRLLPAMVQIEIAVGDTGAARQVADELAARARSAPTPLLTAVAAFAEAGVLLAEGEPAAALAAAGSALAAWDALDAPCEVARCHVLAGRALAAADRHDEASAEFAAAHATFAELGARADLAALEVLTGGRPAVNLTAREIEVLRLAATGLTNRAIAAQLSLSEKTVARHLSNIFLKVGVSSRTAATAYAYEQGLI